jgi:MFS family permease
VARPTSTITNRPGLWLLYGATLCNFLAAGAYFAAIGLYVEGPLGDGRDAVGLAVGAFSLSAVCVRPFVGRAIDARGRRPFLLAALCLFAVSSLGFLVAESTTAVVALRLVQGLSGGTFYTTAAAMATDLAAPERRASAISAFSLFLYGGFAVGPAGLAALGAALVWTLPESGVSQMARRAELGPPKRRIIHPAAVTTGLVLMCSAVGYSSVTAFSSLYAREIGLASSGGLYATFAITILAVRLVAGRLADTRGRIPVALAGLGLSAAGMGLVAAVPVPVAAFVGIGVFGAGFALIFPALMALTIDRTEDHERGEALASYTAFMNIGTGAGAYLVGAIAERAGFGAAYALPAILCVAGFLALLRLARQPIREGASAEVTVDPIG